jgi:hypothetical protein
LVGTLYALGVNNERLFQITTVAMFLLTGLTFILQRRLANERGGG